VSVNECISRVLHWFGKKGIYDQFNNIMCMYMCVLLCVLLCGVGGKEGLQFLEGN